MDTITTITIDYTGRYAKADAFSKTKPTLEQALEFCNRPDIGFTCPQFSGADADGLFTAMFGSDVWGQVTRFGCSVGWNSNTEQFSIRTAEYAQ